MRNQPKTKEKTESLTFLVFQGGKVPRSFTVSRTWFPRLATLISAVAILALLGWIQFGVSSWRRAAAPEETARRALENEVESLRLANEELRARIPAEPTAEAAASTETPVPVPATLPGSLPVLFSPRAQVVPAGTNVPVKLESCKKEWSGPAGSAKLSVRCNLLFTGPAGGEQSGKLLLLARGPTLLAVYPDGALSPSSASAWIPPERGESFRVGRFRAVNAQFGPFASRDSIREVSVWIFDSQGRLLLQAEVP